jgi:hypothetical protein
MFPYSLKDKAKVWLNNLPPGSITNWDILVQKLLYKYFPPIKIAKLMSEINSFSQEKEESLFETWDRFKEMLRKCPHHGLEIWQQVSIVYNGPLPST